MSKILFTITIKPKKPRAHFAPKTKTIPSKKQYKRKNKNENPLAE